MGSSDISRKWGGLLFLVAMFSLFFPSSIDGTIISYLSSVAILFSVLILFLYSSKNSFLFSSLVLMVLFLCLLLLFTILSPLNDFTPGAFLPYLGMAAVLSLRVPDMASNLSIRLFHFCSFVLIALGFGVIYEVSFVRELLHNYYQAYYEELYANMIIYHKKPVGPFSTHSVAAFAYFLFAVLYFSLYRALSAGKLWYLLFSCAFVFLLFNLRSFSSLVLIVLLVTLFLYLELRDGRWQAVVVFFLGVISILMLVDVAPMIEAIANVLSSEGNGLRGRYSENTRLSGTYEYVSTNFISAVGLTSSPDIAFGDNFIADYVLRASAFGYLIVLVSSFLFLSASINGLGACFFAFFLLLLSDLGFPALTNYRILFLLPAFICVWNHSVTMRRRNN